MNHLGNFLRKEFANVPLSADLQDYPDDQTPSQFFHTFHKGSRGWTIDNDGSRLPDNQTQLALAQGNDPGAEEKSFTRFAQRWLFFEVLRSVVGASPDAFVEYKNGEGWISTERLPDLVRQWYEEERQSCEADGQNGRVRSYGRIIRAQRVLDKARYFVSNFCTAKSPDDTNPRWPVDRRVALSIMVLGETLTGALIQIQKAVGFKATGWCNHDQTGALGWGYSGAVLRFLTHRGQWCKHTVFMLQGLMQNNTIGLLYAVQSDPPHKELHPQCSADECEVEKALKAKWSKAKSERNVQKGPAVPNDNRTANATRRGRRRQHQGRATHQALALPAPPPPAEKTSQYELYHDPSCPRGQSCKEIGPDPTELDEIIQRSNVPLICYSRDSDQVRLRSTSINDLRARHIVFSHVWSDGFGNPDSNKMNKCALNYFLRLFRVQDRVQPFYIDTLCVPPRSKNPNANKKALSTLHDVYYNAEYTIVLDRSLMQKQRTQEQFLDLAMSITVSPWMRRLWTLQEAYLSSKIWIALEGDDRYSLETLEDLYKVEGNQLHTNLPEACHAYFDGMLGTDRGQIHRPGITTRDIPLNYRFVAAVWRAVQFRTTSYPQHETLALATLFGLPTDPYAETSDTTNAEFNDADCDTLMRKLLDALASRITGCAIPPGMIFLPRPQLEIKGFGWAPRTWLSARRTEAPDPLSISNAEARLEQGEGLVVQFPGFRLYQMDCRQDTLEMDEKQTISFPAENNLLEWYTLQEADTNWFFKTGFEAESEGLAVIVPRMPLLSPKEIALLVNIKKEVTSILYVDILHRVWISRENDANVIADLQSEFNSKVDGAMLCGEIRPTEQQWCVDRRVVPKTAPVPPSESSKTPSVGAPSFRSERAKREEVGQHQFLSNKARTYTQRAIDAVSGPFKRKPHDH